MDFEKPSATRPERAVPAVRRAFAVTSVVASALLVLTAWRARETSVALADTVTAGQGELLHADLTLRSPPELGPPDLAGMQETLAADRAAGLRAIALVSPDGRVLRAVGNLAPAPFDAEDLRHHHLLAAGERIRLILPPPRVPRRGPPPGAPPGAPPDSPPDSPPGLPPHPPWRTGDCGLGEPPDEPGPCGPASVVIEFEPERARSLLLQSERTLAVAAVGAAVLLVATAWLWRAAVRAEEDVRRAARRDRLAALGTMSAVIAHEIRNPLASLKGNAQLLVEGLADGSRERAQADRVVAGAARLERLTRDLIDFVRDGPLAVQAVDPAALLRAVAAEAAGPVGVESGGAPLSCALDPARVRMALANLIENALLACPEGVVASVRSAEGFVEFRVRDHGPGVPPEDLERIFEPFVTGRTRGTGLGLAVVRRVATLHGGTAWARNHPDGGAEFGLSLRAG